MTPKEFWEKLKTIKVLYRRPDCLTLYGIPYEMRPHQSPKDILEKYRGDWIYLGTPGWYNHYSEIEIKLIKYFLAKLGDRVPEWPHEWSRLGDP